jgi:hypothetical protein
LRIFTVLAVLLVTAPFAQAQERAWSLNASDKEAFLVFGVPDTDDVGISFWCEIGTNKTSLFVNGAPQQLKANQTTSIKVEVENKAFTLKAKTAVDRAGSRPSVEAIMSNNAELLKAAEEASSLKITIMGHTEIYPLIEADFIGLRRSCAGDEVN